VSGKVGKEVLVGLPLEIRAADFSGDHLSVRPLRRKPAVAQGVLLCQLAVGLSYHTVPGNDNRITIHWWGLLSKLDLVISYFTGAFANGSASYKESHIR